MLKYLIIGAGGVGGTLGAYLQRAGLSVSFLAHGKTLEVLKKKGLTIIGDEGEETLAPVAVFDEASYNETPDVIFLALKSYSIDSVLPFLERVATENTVIVPLCNVFGTGEKLQKKLEKPLVTDGCIYVMANVEEPGKIRQLGKLIRVVYGARTEAEARPVLKDIRADLEKAGVEAVLSENIRRDCMKKFAYLSPHGAVGTYFYITVAHLQREGEYRNFYRGLVREVLAIAEKMGIDMGGFGEKDCLAVVDRLAKEMTTSFQKDVAAGKKSEADGLIYEVQRLGKRYGVETPYYDEVIESLKSRGVE